MKKLLVRILAFCGCSKPKNAAEGVSVGDSENIVVFGNKVIPGSKGIEVEIKN